MSIFCWIVFSKRCQRGDSRGLCPGQRVITADIDRAPDEHGNVDCQTGELQRWTDSDD